MDSTIEQNKLLEEAEVSYGVIGRAGDFILVELGNGDEAIAKAVVAGNEKSFRFCGVLALVNGKPAAAVEPDPDAMYCCLMATLEFARIVADRLRAPAATGDAVEWLQKLSELPDARA